MNRLNHICLALRMDLRDLRRRPIILVLLVVTPILFISRAIASTEPLPRTIGLADGTTVTTTMRDVHGAVMAVITVAFLAGLIGVFIMNAARQADKRLVRAGFDAKDAVLARLAVLLVATGVVVAISLAVTAQSFTPHHWVWFAVGTLTAAITYAGIGALSSVVLGRIGATYLLLFLVMLDIGIIQNPMFGNGTPPRWAAVLPGYPTTRTVVDAGLSRGSAVPPSVIVGSVGWLVLVIGLTVWRLTSGLRTVRPSTDQAPPGSGRRRLGPSALPGLAVPAGDRALRHSNNGLQPPLPGRGVGP